MNTEKLARRLHREGIVVVENYLEAEICDDIRERVKSRLEEGSIRKSEEGMQYADLATAGEPIVDKRSGERDDGMLDIFNMDVAIPRLQEVKEDELMLGIINNAAHEHYLPDNLNIYVNRSVTNTRDYHADSYSGKYKAFVYLTDVPDVSYGPFSYVKGSHQPSTLRRRLRFEVNRKLRDDPATNAVFYKFWKVKNCTAPKGTLIIANQAGLHRGVPQNEGKERVMISMSYKKKEEVYTK